MPVTQPEPEPEPEPEPAAAPGPAAMLAQAGGRRYVASDIRRYMPMYRGPDPDSNPDQVPVRAPLRGMRRSGSPHRDGGASTSTSDDDDDDDDYDLTKGESSFAATEEERC